MATYTQVSSDIPSSFRAARITAVAAGDKINLKDVLGRPARKIMFNLTDSADVITYKVNHLRTNRTSISDDIKNGSDAAKIWGVYGTSVTSMWTSSSEFTNTGSTQLETIEGLNIDSIEIISLTLSTGSTITIDCT